MTAAKRRRLRSKAAPLVFCCCVLVSGALLGHGATAQAAPTVMTLADALSYAQQHQPSLRAARARIEAAKRAAWAVRAEWLPQLGEAMEQALARDPALPAAMSKLLSQQALTRATTRQWAPSLALTATISGRAGGAPTSSGPTGLSGWVPSVPNWDVGLVLSAPIFDGVLLARRAQSQATEEILRSEIDVVRRRLLADIQRAYTALRLAEATLPALLAAGQGFSIPALMGVLMVVGIAVSNGILLVDAANHFQQKGAVRFDAAVRAARIRFVPIAMTSLATITGLLPTALGLEPAAAANRPLALAVVGGLASSTVLSLFLVPALFTLLAKRTAD